MTVAPPTSALPSVPVQQVARRASAALEEASWRGAGIHLDVEKGTLGGYAQLARDELTFSDLLDLINPLHHIPGVAQIYRAVTGDAIKPAVKVAGGALFGGPIGVIASAGAAVLEAAIGGDPVVQLAEAVTGAGGAAAEPVSRVVSRTGVPAVVNEPESVATIPPSAARAAGASPNAPTVIGPAEEAGLAALIAASAASAGKRVGPAAAEASAPETNLAAASFSEPGRAGGGKSIQTYFAEAVPRAVSLNVRRSTAEHDVASEPEAAIVPKAIPSRQSGKPSTEPDAPILAGTEAAMPPGSAASDVTPPSTGASADRKVQDQRVPPWFADRVLDGLDRYRAGAKSSGTETAKSPTPG